MAKEILDELLKDYKGEAALAALDEFCAQWDGRYPMIGRSWKTRWTEIAPFLACPAEIRKVIYTSNAVESLNYTLRKVTRNRLSFPTTDAAMKLVYMALQNISQRWAMAIRDWGQALNSVRDPFQGQGAWMTNAIYTENATGSSPSSTVWEPLRREICEIPRKFGGWLRSEPEM